MSWESRLKNLGSFDCVKKSNVKCFLQLWYSQRFRECRKLEKYYYLDYRYNILQNAGTAYLLQSGFILVCYGQFIIWSIFLATKTTKITYFFTKQYSRKCLMQHPLTHTQMFLMFWRRRKRRRSKKPVLAVIS